MILLNKFLWQNYIYHYRDYYKDFEKTEKVLDAIYNSKTRTQNELFYKNKMILFTSEETIIHNGYYCYIIYNVVGSKQITSMNKFNIFTLCDNDITGQRSLTEYYLRPYNLIKSSIGSICNKSDIARRNMFPRSGLSLLFMSQVYLDPNKYKPKNLQVNFTHPKKTYENFAPVYDQESWGDCDSMLLRKLENETGYNYNNEMKEFFY